MIFLITGCPGTGKTTLAKEIVKKLKKSTKTKYINISKFIKDYNISEGYDSFNKCLIINELTLRKFFKEYLKKTNYDSKKETIIIDSHILFLTKSQVKQCFVINCDIKTLNSRLKKRKYNIQKVKDNLDSEIFDYCFNEALDKKYNKISAINNTYKKNFNKNVNFISSEILNSLS